jgi:serine phosphatase RsbU (regulator of sigma subunit)
LLVGNKVILANFVSDKLMASLLYIGFILNSNFWGFDYYLIKPLFVSVFTSASPSASNTPYIYFLYAVLAIALVYLLVASQARILLKTRRLLKEKELAFTEITRQREELEIKNKSITDSLIYAQRIQEALLPSPSYFKKHFNESFILFSPKDIVSGDFYWVGEKGDKVFIVAADCTGHGVPGALMSMIGLEILEKIINQDNICKPSIILELLSRGIEKAFSREKNDGTIIRDGMDIGLCVVDKKENKLEYSGAFFPLYIIRNDKLIEIKGDKFTIGNVTSDLKFINNEFILMDNDIVYLFSDGYMDQFGGSDNKKFMYRRFRYLLLSIHKFEMNDQKTILEENMKTWMAGNEQVDDMLVIGFKPSKEIS